MSDLFDGFIQALMLIFTLDKDLYVISGRSLQVTLTATLIASLVGIPFGSWLAVSNFRFRSSIIVLINALMGLPPVVIGLLVYLLLSKVLTFFLLIEDIPKGFFMSFLKVEIKSDNNAEEVGPGPAHSP